MEFDVNKIVQDIFKNICSGGTLIDFNPAQAMIIDGTSIFGDTKSWYLHNKEENMEKKKMTKAEAFEWLKGTKVVLRTIDDQLDLQKRLFDIGYKWRLSGTQLVKLYDVSCVFFLGIDGFIQHEEYEDESNKLFCDTHVYKPIELCDILSIEIVEEADGLKYGSSWDEITRLGAQISKILDDMPGHCRVEITECTVNLYNEGVNLYHSDPF